MLFPEDFTKKSHTVVPGATQWLLKDVDDNNLVSIVGGGYVLYGNGITTFEMWDFREDGPQGYLSVEDINTHLLNNPF